jgi:hypothetical protein
MWIEMRRVRKLELLRHVIRRHHTRVIKKFFEVNRKVGKSVKAQIDFAARGRGRYARAKGEYMEAEGN